MDIVTMEETNTIYAKDQDEYEDLPCHKHKDGTVTTCWRLTFIESLKVFFTGKIYLQMLTFNKALQPVKISVNKPEQRRMTYGTNGYL